MFPAVPRGTLRGARSSRRRYASATKRVRQSPSARPPVYLVRPQGWRYRDIAMSPYITTNLRFRTETYRELRYQAHRRRTTLAVLVREAVDQYLGRAGETRGSDFGDDPVDRIIGSVSGSA